jgi:hypothetical protein
LAHPYRKLVCVTASNMLNLAHWSMS